MPREYAQINIGVWNDPEFRALPPAAQHLYLVLWTDPGLSYCGVLDWRPGRIAARAARWTTEDLQRAAACLRARHFLVIDDDTEECLIRSWVRWDGLMKQPRLAVSYANAFGLVASNLVRGVVVDELHKLRERQPMLAGLGRPQVLPLFDLKRVSAKRSVSVSDPFGDDLGDGFAPGLAQTLPSVSVPPSPSPSPAPTSSSKSSSEIGDEEDLEPSSEVASDPDSNPRDEVVALCERLAAGVVRNGHKQPTVGKRWFRAMRLLLDVDGRTVEQVERAIDWAMGHPFWSTNVRSAQTLREKYDTLRAQAAQPKPASGPSRRQQERDDALATARQEAAAFDAAQSERRAIA